PAARTVPLRPAGPPRRSSDLGPAAASRVRRLGVDVTRDDVRLDAIAVESRARARVVDRVQQREELAGAIAVAERREGHDRPDRPDRKSTRLNSSHQIISYAGL